MPSSSILRILIAIATGFAVAWYGFHSGARDGDKEPGANARPSSLSAAQSASAQGGEEEGERMGEVAALRKEVNSLRSDLAALRSQLQAQATQFKIIAATENQFTPSGGEAADSMADEVDPAEAEAQTIALMEQEKERSLARAQANETDFRAQAVDSAWAGEADSLIQKAFASEELKETFLGEVQCRKTLCRVEVSHEDEIQRARFEHRFPLMVAQMLPSIAMHTTENADGSSVTVVYLAREGSPLPQDELRY